MIKNLDFCLENIDTGGRTSVGARRWAHVGGRTSVRPYVINILAIWGCTLSTYLNRQFVQNLVD